MLIDSQVPTQTSAKKWHGSCLQVAHNLVRGDGISTYKTKKEL